MDAISYVRSLLPDFDKERINEEVRITTAELHDVTLPMLKDSARFFGQYELKADKSVRLLNIFNAVLKVNKKNFVTKLHDGMQVVNTNLASVAEMIERTYDEDIIAQGLTYKKAVLLQYVEAVSFVSRFSRRLLNYIYVTETAEYGGDTKLEDSLTPADIEWIEGNFLNFANSFKSISKPFRDVKGAIEAIPDVQVTPDNMKTMSAVVGKDKLDPLQFGFVPVSLNPIFHIRIAWSDWQTNRYHAAKQEIKCLQLRRANLEALANGKPDAKLQKQINYIEDRIQGLLRKNAEMERRYG